MGDEQQGPVILPDPFAQAQPSGILGVQEGMRTLHWSLPRGLGTWPLAWLEACGASRGSAQELLSQHQEDRPSLVAALGNNIQDMVGGGQRRRGQLKAHLGPERTQDPNFGALGPTQPLLWG